jgi:hypothetical protein
MEKVVFYVSDCCGVESDKDYEICSSCGEHCEIVTDDSLERDYIPGYKENNIMFKVVQLFDGMAINYSRHHTEGEARAEADRLNACALQQKLRYKYIIEKI